MNAYIFLFGLLVLGSTQAFAQTDTTKIEQYCDLMARGKSFTSEVTIEINYGDKIEKYAERRIKDAYGNPVKFNSVIDALNYMGKMGWRLAQTLPVYTPNGTVEPLEYHYIFRKEVPKNR